MSENQEKTINLDVIAYQNAIVLITKIPYYMAKPILEKLKEAEIKGKEIDKGREHITN